ncbi:MAG: hypothetical protein QM610_11030 [Chitinophagaceae bacterium]
MQFDDALWKNILEDLFVDFLRFFFPNADEVFDFDKGVTFLDKEMAAIARDKKPTPSKYVDKLGKLFTKDGGEHWALCQVEAQGYIDKHLGLRMFSYWTRIHERYGQRITAIAIFTDNNPRYSPSEYRSGFMGTEVLYKFNTYKVRNQDEKELEKNDNPFAFVILAVLLALKKGKLTDDNLLDLKIGLIRRLLRQKFPRAKIDAIFYFIGHYVSFSDPEKQLIFEKEIEIITENNKTMGVVELIRERKTQELLQKGREEGIEKGLKQGKVEGKAEGKSEVVRNLILKLGLSDTQAADVAGVSEAFVKKVRASLKKK